MTTVEHREPLPPGQLRVLNFIAGYIGQHGYSPTIREICVAFSFGSTEGAMCHLRALRRKGWLDWQDNHARTIRITEGTNV